MTARLLALDLVAVLVVATLWVAVAAVLRTGRSRLALGLLAAAVLATAARVVLVAVLARSGWWFVQRRCCSRCRSSWCRDGGGRARGPSAAGGRRPGRFAAASAAAAAGGAATGVLGTFVVGYPVSTTAAVLLPLLVVAAAVVVVGPRSAWSGWGSSGCPRGRGRRGVVGSRVPDRVEHTGHTGHAHHAVSVADLRGPTGEPTRRFTLTARPADVVLPGALGARLDVRRAGPRPQLTVRRATWSRYSCATPTSPTASRPLARLSGARG